VSAQVFCHSQEQASVDHLQSSLHIDKTLQRTNLLTFTLLAEMAAACTAESVTTALRRHVQFRIERVQRERRNSCRDGRSRDGRRLAGLSIVMLTFAPIAIRVR